MPSEGDQSTGLLFECVVTAGSRIGKNGQPGLVIAMRLKPIWGQGRKEKKEGGKGPGWRTIPHLGCVSLAMQGKHQLTQLDYFLQRGSTMEKGVEIQGA